MSAQIVWWAAVLSITTSRADAPPQLLDALKKEGVAALAKAARKDGDAGRGAVAFFRAESLCSRCHAAGEGTSKLGPDLAAIGKDATDEHLVESILFPSKTIRKGYETVVVTTSRGKTVTGLVAEDRADALVLRDADRDGETITVLKKDIDQRNDKALSLMPEGLVNSLSGRQEFLDLTRYLIEIASGGAARAHELRPAASLLAPPPLPDYESKVDHAGLIRGLDKGSLKRGEAIYTRVCSSCHGTREQPGSLPASLRFAEGKFKSGPDPFSMYRTLTHGFGLMTPQPWMVPRQKYDVIHYVREAYLRTHNPSQYTTIDDAYLAGLPKGITKGPVPSNVEPWSSMNYGPTMMVTLEVGNGGNFAYKGIVVRLDSGPGGVSRGRHWSLLDHDTLRLVAAWGGDFIDWKGINFNGQHQVHPRLAAPAAIANAVGPGWADPETGKFDDPRPKGRDGKPYGPLPRSWGRYRGMYHFGQQAIISYTVGDADVLETPSYELSSGRPVYARTLDIGKSSRDMLMRVAPATTAVAALGGTLSQRDGSHLLRIAATATPCVVKVLMSDGDSAQLQEFAKTLPAPSSLKPFTKGGPPRWPEALKTAVTLGNDAEPFAVDVLAMPENNPWSAQMRLTGLDFAADGRSAFVCSWDGDVWRIDGLDDPRRGHTWRRIASGLFQPLGIKLLRGKVHVCCRDQIAVLHDLDGDGETDFYECLNSDHQVTEHFHEFAMGLQADSEGNLYYAKAARHALKALVPHHGTLLKVSRDGSKTEILATGFRAANGVCLNPDGTFFVTDQEGFWLPKNRINLVRRGEFHGNFWGYHDKTDSSDAAMTQPVCWVTNSFDRSPSEPLWADGWGPLRGSLLNFSYGYGKVFVVLRERAGDLTQGGMVALPLPAFPTGVMRGRFHADGSLYCCGMFAWAGNQTRPGGLYRVRYTDKPLHVPTGLRARKSGIEMTFPSPLDAKSIDAKGFTVRTWSLRRTANYGSKHHDEKDLKVTAATASADGKTVTLTIDGLQPTMGMEIKYDVRAPGGAAVRGVIHNTIHKLGE